MKCGLLTLLAASCLFAQAPMRVQTFPLRDTAGLIAPKVKTDAVKYLGRKSVRITMEGKITRVSRCSPEPTFRMA